MKMTRGEFDKKLNDYAVQKFIPAVSNPLTRFVLGTAAGSGAIKLTLVGEPVLTMLGIVGEDGLVDIDIMKKAVQGGFDASGGTLPVNRFGIGNLDKGDADALFAYLEGM